MTHRANLHPRVATVLLALVGWLYGWTHQALALATEHFGNDPVTLNLGQDVRALANLKTRFYWFEVNGNPTFYYQGKADALNQALQKFAALAGATRELIVLPGPGQGHNLIGDRSVAYDWYVHTPAGISLGGPRR
jgi:hypothetical protein